MSSTKRKEVNARPRSPGSDDGRDLTGLKELLALDARSDLERVSEEYKRASEKLKHISESLSSSKKKPDADATEAPAAQSSSSSKSSSSSQKKPEADATEVPAAQSSSSSSKSSTTQKPETAGTSRKEIPKRDRRMPNLSMLGYNTDISTKDRERLLSEVVYRGQGYSWPSIARALQTMSVAFSQTPSIAKALFRDANWALEQQARLVEDADAEPADSTAAAPAVAASAAGAWKRDEASGLMYRPGVKLRDSSVQTWDLFHTDNVRRFPSLKRSDLETRGYNETAFRKMKRKVASTLQDESVLDTLRTQVLQEAVDELLTRDDPHRYIRTAMTLQQWFLDCLDAKNDELATWLAKDIAWCVALE